MANNKKLFIKLPIRAKSSQDKQIARFGKRFGLRNSNSTLAFKEEVLKLLLEYKASMAIFKREFNPKIHSLHAEWTFCYSNLYTKKGEINSRCCDLGNDIKCVQDLIMNKAIGIDDKFITYCEIRKIEEPDSIELFLTIQER